jgi:hypothetical protein
MVRIPEVGIYLGGTSSGKILNIDKGVEKKKVEKGKYVKTFSGRRPRKFLPPPDAYSRAHFNGNKTSEKMAKVSLSKAGITFTLPLPDSVDLVLK